MRSGAPSELPEPATSGENTGRRRSIGRPVAQPIAQLSLRICRHQPDGVDRHEALSSKNATERDGLDQPARTLKVATRVRIPLGLLRIFVHNAQVRGIYALTVRNRWLPLELPFTESETIRERTAERRSDPASARP